MNGRIYIHKNKINGKCYVGQTTQKPKHRWGINGIKYKDSPKFYNAIQKYGWNNFEHIVLPTIYTNIDELNQAEIDVIKDLDSIDNGYNISSGGYCRKQNQDFIDKVSKPIIQFDLHGKEIKVWKSAKEIERQLNISTRAIRKTAKEQLGTAHGYIWKYEKNKNQPHIENTRYKEVCQFTLDGDLVANYKSVKEAAIITKTHKDSISNVCRKKTHTANNYKWRYIWLIKD
jgi:group I intron endonuclease